MVGNYDRRMIDKFGFTDDRDGSIILILQPRLVIHDPESFLPPNFHVVKDEKLRIQLNQKTEQVAEKRDQGSILANLFLP